MLCERVPCSWNARGSAKTNATQSHRGTPQRQLNTRLLARETIQRAVTGGPGRVITEINGIHLILFGMQNGTLAAIT
jgi:hypothetical protein